MGAGLGVFERAVWLVGGLLRDDFKGPVRGMRKRRVWKVTLRAKQDGESSCWTTRAEKVRQEGNEREREREIPWAPIHSSQDHPDRGLS